MQLYSYTICNMHKYLLNICTVQYIYSIYSLFMYMLLEIDHVMQAGKKNRSTGATLMNQTSSRSHSIFTIVVECADLDTRGNHIRVGQLNLVDLAGSERQDKVFDHLTYIHTDMYTYIHTYIYIYILYIHTYIYIQYIHMYTYIINRCCNLIFILRRVPLMIV
jgi:hypothetical protein